MRCRPPRCRAQAWERARWAPEPRPFRRGPLERLVRGMCLHTLLGVRPVLAPLQLNMMLLAAAGAHPCPQPDPGPGYPPGDGPEEERRIVPPPPYVRDTAEARLAALQPEATGAAIARLRRLLSYGRAAERPLRRKEAAPNSPAALDAARARSAALAAQATGDLGPVVDGLPRPPRELIALLQAQALSVLAAAAACACQDIAVQQLLRRGQHSLVLHWLSMYGQWRACQEGAERGAAAAAPAVDAALERQLRISQECTNVAAEAGGPN